MCDDLDLDAGAAGEGRNLDGGSGREWGFEKLSVNCIHGRKFTQIDHENGGLDDVAGIQALVSQENLNVLKDASGLWLDASFNQVSGRGIERNLPGAEEKITCPNAVAVRADGFRRICGRNRLRSHKLRIEKELGHPRKAKKTPHPEVTSQGGALVAKPGGIQIGLTWHARGIG